MSEYDNELSKIVAELNRAAPSQKTAERVPRSTASLEELLKYAAGRNASDVLLIAGAPPVLRVQGALVPGTGPGLEPEDVNSYVLPLLEPPQLEELRQKKSVDLGFVREGLGRFRVNLHHQRGTVAASIRLLPARIPSLESLHLPASLAKLAERRQGLVLVTGPTGCGKSSTLAALIDLVNTRRAAHVVTIEDPVEYQHANRSAIIEQIEVGRDTPDFAGTLRSILRQTPDVILVGEMRDAETIATVLTGAETGHLVLSTLHTNDAPSSITRLINIGIEPFLISAALNAVLAQRLVRKICSNCKRPVDTIRDTHAAYLKRIGATLPSSFQGAGCDKCHQSGYKGRMGIYEFLELNEGLRDVISNNPSLTDLRRAAKTADMRSIQEDGLAKVAQGTTTLEEVMRVTET